MSKKKGAKQEKRKVGRPTAYRPEYCQDIINYFSVEPIIFKDITITHKDGSTIDKTEMEAAPTPYMTDWLAKIGVDPATLKRWVEKYPEFRNAYKRAKQLQREFIIENALKATHSAVFSIFMLKNVCKWQDREDENWTDKHEFEGEGLKANVTIRIVQATIQGNPSSKQGIPGHRKPVAGANQRLQQAI